MRKEDIDGYSRRIISSNTTGIVVILYEIYFSYEQDVVAAEEAGDWESYRDNIRRCLQVIDHLKRALDFGQRISSDLYSIYIYVQTALHKAIYSRKISFINDANRAMKPLYEGFAEIAARDKSEPVMSNAQQVTVGITYGKGALNESVGNMEYNRGYLV